MNARAFTFPLLILCLMLVACSPEGDTPPTRAAPAPTTTAAAETPTLGPTPSPTPLPKPERTLVVCVAQEPESLYPYAASGAEARTILQALYDGPYDQRGFGYQPVILEKMPTLADGDAMLGPVQAAPGDLVIDQAGNLVPLTAGVRVRPSGCYEGACAVEYTGEGPIQMDRLEVSFRLLAGLNWADGAPLTAQDSVFSFELAGHPDTPASKFKTSRTASYEAIDDRTVRWTGVPGFLDPTFQANFWTPYPSHAWASYAPGELPAAEAAARRPLGYGPYSVTEWVEGDHIRLRINPNYFRAAEGLPRFENLLFRFTGLESGASVDRLLSGECDLLDRTVQLDDQLERLRELAGEGRINLYLSPGLEWEHVVFGIRPASYDDGYNPLVDRADLLGDPRTRQGLASCMDRARVVGEVLGGAVPVPGAYLSHDHPLNRPDLPQYPFDVAAGVALLEEVGWFDHDGDPATPRQAQGVFNVPPGTPLTVTFLTTGAPQRLRAAEILAASLSECGVGVTLEPLLAESFYASGPQGQVFGRAFDLAQLAWQTDLIPACHLFLGQAVPGEVAFRDEDGNQAFPYGWAGWNASGYDSPEFNAACLAARSTVPGQGIYLEKHQEAQGIFATDLPAVPLYMHLLLGATRPDLCNFTLDGTAPADLWGLEGIDYGEDCL